jgi:peptidoglycan/xylan/chitin deacetylase (PgdA/CDA1 family)
MLTDGRAAPARLSRLLKTALLALVCALTLPAMASAQTVVSLEFDDGLADQYQVLPMLQTHGMTATFFVNSGVVSSNTCTPSDSGSSACSHMTWSELHNLADAGSEIGGHTVAHANLPYLDSGEQQREVCNDRVNLMNNGFTVTDFAYPYGSYNATTESIVQGCGYNSARDVKGIVSPGQCAGCPYAETIPPANAYATRTPQNVLATDSLSTIEGYVTQAEQHGGGWVQLVFHHVCNSCDVYAITPSDLSSLMDWLQPRGASGTVVETVNQVIGGGAQPAVSGPPPPPPPSGSNLVWNSSFESSSGGRPTCFQNGAYGNNTNSVSQVTDGPPFDTGFYAEQLTVSNYVSGDAKILTQQDLGSCAPQLNGGTRYVVSAWYRSTAPTLFILFARNPLGGWSYWTESPLLQASAGWTQATFTTPALPAGDTGISFGLGLVSNGTLTVDDYSMAAAPATSPTSNMLQNPSLETANANGIPTCFQTGNGAGTNTATWSRSSNAHTGTYAEQVQITSYTSGDQKLISAQDSGSCAPAARAGHSYAASAWYISNQPVHLVAYYHVPGGPGNGWVFWAQSSSLPASATYTKASWITPALPANADLISVGMSLRAVGTMTVDDFSLTDADTTPPTVSVTSPTDGSTVTGTTVNLAATATAGQYGQIDHVEFMVDGQLVGSSYTAPYSYNWDSTAVANGSHTVTARAVDWAGNSTVSAQVTITVSNGPPVDTTPPTVSLTSPATGSDLAGTVLLAANASDDVGVSHVDFLVDGTVVATAATPPYATSWDSSSVSDGSHTISARAYDTSGNIAESPVSVTVDNTAPTSWASAPAMTNTASINVSYIAADTTSGVATVNLYVKGPSDAGYSEVASTPGGALTGSFTYTASEGDGSYSFYMQAVDNAGNLEPAHAGPDATTIVDATPPSASVVTSPYATASAWSVAYTASAGPAGLAEVDLYVKGPNDAGYGKVASDTSGAGSGSLAFTASEGDGTYRFYAIATDNAGNVQAAPSSAQATTVLDTVAPSSAASSAAMSNKATIGVSYTASDNQGGSGVAEVDLYAEAPGQSSYSKVASDTSGAASGSFSYVAPAGDGTYRFYTVATDNAGNVQASPSGAQATTLLDTVAPASQASAPPPAYSSPIVVSYTASDNQGGSGLAEVDLYAEGPGQSSYSRVASDTSGSASGTFNYTPSSGGGTYAFYTIAADNAGNAQATPSSAQTSTSYVVDTTAPTSKAGSPAVSTSPGVTVSYSASDNGGGDSITSVELWVKAPGAGSFSKTATNTGSAAGGSFSFTASAGDGSYAFYTIATDQSGNREVAPGAPDTTTTIDTQPPSAFAMADPGTYLAGGVALSLSSAPTDSGTGVASVTYQYRPNGSSTWFTACTSTTAPWSCNWNTATSPTPDGSYDLRALAADGVGHTTVASNTPFTGRSILNTPPAAKSVSTTDGTPNTKGKAEKGDSVTFTYTEPIQPNSILAGWNGSATAVQVQLSGNNKTNTAVTVWKSDGSAQLPLASPMLLGAVYNNSALVVFNGTMVQTGSAITVTLGSLASGTVNSKAVTGGTLTWTASSGATNLAGVKGLSTSVTAPGPAF